MDVTPEAAANILREIPVHAREETILLEEAHDRLASRSVRAEENHPCAMLSLVDGYAISRTQVDERGLSVVGEVLAGHDRDIDLADGEAVVVTAGAVVPPRAEAVVREGECKREENRIYPLSGVYPGQNIQEPGSEVRAGETLVRAGTLIRGEELALLAVAGVAEVQVFCPLRVGVLNTGTEVLPVGAARGDHQKTNSNFFWLMSQLKSQGADPELLGLTADDTEAICDTLMQRTDLDLIISTGGLGKGRADLMREVWDRVISEHLIYSLAVRPVRKAMLGHAGDTYYVALPGAPAAVRSLYRFLVAPLLARMQGRQCLQFNELAVILGETVRSRHRENTTLREGYLDLREGRWTFRAAPGTPGGERTMAGEKTAHLIIPPGEDTLACGQIARVLV